MVSFARTNRKFKYFAPPPPPTKNIQFVHDQKVDPLANQSFAVHFSDI